MKLRDYLDALRIEENTAVGIRINDGAFGNVVAKIADIAQYWSYEDDQDFRESIDDPEMAYQYEHRLRYHGLTDEMMSEMNDYLDYDFVAVTPMVNPMYIRAYMTTEPDESHPVGNPLYFAWDKKQVQKCDLMDEYHGDVLVLNVLVKKPEDK